MFRVEVRGRGIDFDMGGKRIEAFLAVVWVAATDQQAAQVEALTVVRTDWKAGRWSRMNLASGPELDIVKVSIEVRPWWRRLLFGTSPAYAFIAYPKPSNSRWSGP